MRTLARIAKQGTVTGKALPRTLRALDRLEARFRTGEVSVIAGPPGAGKTALALHIAIAMGIPTLYISADSGDSTQMIRALAMLTGLTQKEAEDQAAADPDWAADLLKHLNIWWGGDELGFDAAPSMGTIASEVRAFTMVMGRPPELIIVDSLYNVEDGDESGSMWAGLMQTVSNLKRYAAEAEAAVVVLHHTNEGKELGDGEAPALSALQGKVGPLPALVLTLANDPAQGLLRIAAVKNRHGIADRSGLTPELVRFDPVRMGIRDLDDR